MASCSREIVRGASRRKILDNDLVSSSSGIYEVEQLIRKKYPSLQVSMNCIEFAPNQSNQLLSVSRSIKSYSKSAGPLDSVRLVIGWDILLFFVGFGHRELSFSFAGRRLAFVAPDFSYSWPCLKTCWGRSLTHAIYSIVIIICSAHGFSLFAWEFHAPTLSFFMGSWWFIITKP